MVSSSATMRNLQPVQSMLSYFLSFVADFTLILETVFSFFSLVSSF